MIVVGDRVKNHFQLSYSQDMVPLLPNGHPFTSLYVQMVHNEGHNGVSTTVAKVRSTYWVIRLRKLVASIRQKCIKRKKYDGHASEQKMALLPTSRVKPSPPWTYIGVDLFGPFLVLGEVQKRVRGKAYSIIFTCMVTRAVHLEVAADYSTDSLQKVFRRFAAQRGYSTEIYSDCGSQLMADREALNNFGVQHCVVSKFSAPDAPWQNGVTESLIRGVEKALFHAVGEQVMTSEELQTVLFEVANLMNSRPIGQHPTNPKEGGYL